MRFRDLHHIVTWPRHIWKEALGYVALIIIATFFFIVGFMFGEYHGYDIGWDDSYDYYLEEGIHCEEFDQA